MISFNPWSHLIHDFIQDQSAKLASLEIFLWLVLSLSAEEKIM